MIPGLHSYNLTCKSWSNTPSNIDVVTEIDSLNKNVPTHAMKFLDDCARLQIDLEFMVFSLNFNEVLFIN